MYFLWVGDGERNRVCYRDIQRERDGASIMSSSTDNTTRHNVALTIYRAHTNRIISKNFHCSTFRISVVSSDLHRLWKRIQRLIKILHLHGYTKHRHCSKEVRRRTGELVRSRERQFESDAK